MPLKLTKREGVWQYSGTVAGRRLRRSTGTADKALAERIRAEAEAAAWKHHLDGPEAHVTFAQASIAYRDAEKSDRFLDRIEDFWRDTPIRKITGEAIRSAARKLYPDAKGATRNRQVIVPTAAIINYAAELGWCAPVKVKRFPVEVKEKICVTPEWATAFALEASPHLGALCLFMFGTGARISEALRVTWADVDLTKRTVHIRQTKNGLERVSHLQQPVVVALGNIPSNRNPEDPVWSYADRSCVTQPWAAVEERAGLDHRSPHCCRHGFATQMLRAGYDVKTVAKMGGWKDASVVLRTYAHAIEDRTVTEAVFGTNVAQRQNDGEASIEKERKNTA